jgi:nucleoporin NUP82
MLKTYSQALRFTFAGQITHLSVSPDGEYMAIASSHTIHIAVLPDSSHLGSNDFGPLRLKTFQVGPTAHVVEQSPLASILWHPLGVDGKCLVTVTKDATVRLWEINRDNRSSFAEPSFSVDLRKLANATNAEEDLRASAYGAGKGFSPDAVELEVAAACFGRNTDLADGCPWPAMTLWIATTEGDLYALCPLLPRRWQLRASAMRPPPLAGLAASIRARSELVLRNDSASEGEKRAALQQRQWLAELLEQPSGRNNDDDEFDYIKQYSRPRNTPAEPRLQGPFLLAPELDVESEVTDIFVMPLRDSGSGDLFENEEIEGDEEDALASAICLSTKDGFVRICVDPEGVEARWLPSTKVWTRIFPPRQHKQYS